MPRPALPAACHWAGTPEAPILMFNYRVVAVINPAERRSPITICLMWGGRTINATHQGSLATAKRYIERWVAAQDTLPGQRRVQKRAHAARNAAARDWSAAIGRSMKW